MAILMGPVLSFRGLGDDGRRWQLSALVVTDSGAPGLLSWQDRAGGGEVGPDPLWSVGGRAAYRYRFSAPLGDEPARFRYKVLDQGYEVHLPAAGRTPRMAYTSCNGFSSPKAMMAVRDKNAMWSVVAKRHAAAPYHLLLQGGDQVYADSMWEVVPSMKAWNALGFRQGNEAPFTAEMGEGLKAFYFDLYVERWAQPEVAAVLARVPTVAMWDDHDIIDGWGSYPPERQDCDVFKGMWPIAERAFATFQQQLAVGEARPGAIGPGHGHSHGHVVGRTAILAVDMRSERTAKRVLTLEHWEAVYAWLDALPAGLDHLLLMSSIPVVYPGFDTLEGLLGLVPGQQELDDDLRDQWNSRPHKGERLRLIHRLLAFARGKRIRPTIVSGDVHLAALGLIESTRDPPAGSEAVINQLISSGVVHPAPGAATLFALRQLFASADEVDRGITARMVEFPGTQRRFIGARNFLSLEPDPNDSRIWANWFVEGEDDPYVKVVHALS